MQPRFRSREILGLLVIALLFLLPFLSKPFHIDDPLYVWTAQHIRAHPLDFYGFRLNWEGHIQPVSQFLENPPFTSYLLAAVSLISGFRPIAFHLFFLVFNLLSVVGTYLLAMRFCRRPFLAALLLLLCPAFLISATSLMCEPPLMCFWIWSVCLWVNGTDGKPMMLPLAGIVLTVAVMTKFMAIVLLPLLILYSICRSSTSRLRALQAVSLALPIGGAIAYEIFTIHRYGIGGFTGAFHYVADTHTRVSIPIAAGLWNALCFAGGCAAGCVFILPLLVRRWITIAFVLLFLLLTVIECNDFLPPQGWAVPVSSASQILIAPFNSRLAFFSQEMFWTVGGLALMTLATTRFVKSFKNKNFPDESFLFAWIAGIFIFTACINWSINARALLPMLPPVCILVVRNMDSVALLPRYKTIFLLGISAVLTLLVTRADFNLATTIKDAALQSSALTRPDLPPGGQLWFTGHWGFQYYLQTTGALPVDDRSPQLKTGDLLINPEAAYGGSVGATDFVFVRRIEIGPRRWIGITRPDMGARFYCSWGDGLPFIFGPMPINAFDILRVTSKTRVSP